MPKSKFSPKMRETKNQLEKKEKLLKKTDFKLSATFQVGTF